MKKPPKKPAPPKKPSAMDKMIADAVAKAKARKKSGQTDREWREQYAQTLKVEDGAAPMSDTPFDGAATKKRRES